MKRHFFLDKTNTIIRGSKINMGLNPVMQIAYGNGVSRGLLHFNTDEIRDLINDRTISDTDTMRVYLRMTNCMSVDGVPYEKSLIRSLGVSAKRAASFDLMLFRIPLHWDAGRGFDYTTDFWIHNRDSYSEEGSNWYACKTGLQWNGDLLPIDLKNVEGGIYSLGNLRDEYEKFLKEEDSIVVGTQHFSIGNENLSINITDYVKDCLSMERDENYGLCLSFIPQYEMMETDMMQYVGFFTDNTNTFFHPYIELTYDDYIHDDRAEFRSRHSNNLYLYTSDDGEPVNLDTLPHCIINGQEMKVRQITKGVYRASVPLGTVPVTKEPVMYEDIWTGLSFGGCEADDVVMEFTASGAQLSAGSVLPERRDVVPSVCGIGYGESLTRHETRRVEIDFRVKYETELRELMSRGFYRLYTMDGNREYSVFDYQPINKGFLTNFFVVHTQDFIPGEYFMDISVVVNGEKKLYRKVLKFRIVSDVTERYG